MDFYRCESCGNFITFLTPKTACTPMCCGKTMTKLEPNTTDGAMEKHVPVIEKDGNKVIVRVGSVEHPMLEAHYIQFIVLETKQGYQKKDLKPGDKPCAEFVLADGDEAVAAYEYCNLHGLWKKEA
ncbi:MAG: desulfoferrodoxin family protein [Lachnospiraceae bacterium]|jgi:superoxide reductase|nr:desulfoferrodoxin Dfx [Lachnospiraceae bacterium]MCH4067108.1 desulfoferrodoxin Dfx [Lachnospiraceae bacterium]MCH4113134.1 desulfoferrodoxin Dfx [Lachnospiraceae bacterium]MCI1353545.1 desulfoferrodoxin Dfx [Lachnospiraceae bacterium]MCI1367576.1 desulfoferrodoxin Dfx [Lachnospiraceae bacterium]